MKDLHNPPSPLSELPDCLEAKRRALSDFLAMTESLRDRLTTQDLPEGERLLNQRRGLIDTIDRIDARIQEIRSRHPLDQGSLPEAQRKRVLLLLNNIRDISEKAQIVDKECTDRMTSWRDHTKSQLSRMRDSLKAVHGYARKPIRPPKFLDVIR